jgi:hypothetical protein
MTTSTSKAKTKKAGRPKGAKTAERVAVKTIVSREACPHCGSKQAPVKTKLVREGKASGECMGQPYGYYRLYAANCAGCGLAFALTEYDPPAE